MESNEKSVEKSAANERMKGYVQKVASGPEMSKDLTEEEARDALVSILRGAVSEARAATFLIALRMKRETLEENRGFWKALNQTCEQRILGLPQLLQIADPFDGFNRTGYFGFYVAPVLAEIGLPTYGHSAISLPPKYGITFEDLLTKHYGVSADGDLESRARLIESFRFGWLGAAQSHPLLEGLRNLREETVKRSMLATFEKMLIPLKAETNFLATGYFHPGYEVPMLEAARLGDFNRAVMGNGSEGTTLYGAHKSAPAKIFIYAKEESVREASLSAESMFNPATAQEVREAFAELKGKPVELEELARQGEGALRDGSGPAATLIACQAGSLAFLFGIFPDAQSGFDAAQAVLRQGVCREKLLRYLDSAREG